MCHEHIERPTPVGTRRSAYLSVCSCHTDPVETSALMNYRPAPQQVLWRPPVLPVSTLMVLQVSSPQGLRPPLARSLAADERRPRDAFQQPRVWPAACTVAGLWEPRGGTQTW